MLLTNELIFARIFIIINRIYSINLTIYNKCVKGKYIVN